MDTNLLNSVWLTADGTSWVMSTPPLDALTMEVVPCIAWKSCHERVLCELCHADHTLSVLCVEPHRLEKSAHYRPFV